MKYTIEADGIHLIVETVFDDDYPAVKPPIPMGEAVAEVERVAANIREGLKLACECEAQGAPTKCGACE